MKILIVDDDKHILEMVKFNLELDQHTVITAGNGQDGVNAAKKHHPDVVLMDWMMPAMDGLKATKLIKEDPTLKNTPVFMLTAKTQISDFDMAFAAGADNYITKPFDPVDLSSTIEDKMAKIKK